MKVKKGDKVIVISGNDKGRTGTIVQAMPRKDRVVVEGVNMRWHHRKPTQQNPQGERVQQEVSIHVSNVMLLDESTGKGTRKRPEKS